MKLVLAISLLGLALAGHSAEEWKSRAIYQVVTDRFARNNGTTTGCSNLGNYCGGGFVGLMNNLDYIQNMGFDAIWISPVIRNTPGGYHGYWAEDFYEINPHFGTEQDLKNLISEMHRRDMWIMFDVVANNVGPIGTSLQNVGEIKPFYKKSYYHPYCKINWDSKYSIENCWLNDLPDLNQFDPYVKRTLLSWVSDLMTKFDVDGLRIDTCLEVPISFWKDFKDAAGLFTMCDVTDEKIEVTSEYQGTVDSVQNYPLYRLIRDLFQKDYSFSHAVQFAHDNRIAYRDPEVLGNFVDNQDVRRFLNELPKINRFQNALAFIMTWPGIPIVYYGDEQGFNGGVVPENREPLWPKLNATNSTLYNFVSKVAHFRKDQELWKHDFIERYHADNFYCFSRGRNLMAFTNTDSSIQYTISYHPFNKGEVVCNIFDQSDCLTVDGDGVRIYMNKGEVKLYKPKSSVVNS